MDGRKFQQHIVLLCIGVLVAASVPVVASDGEITGIKITKRTDADNDGYLGSFTIHFGALTGINDAGNFFKPMAFQNKGEPKFMIADTTVGTRALKIDQVKYDARVDPYTLSLKQMNDDGQDLSYDRLKDGSPIKSLTVKYYESDSHRWDVERNDDQLDKLSIVVNPPIKLERPSEDKLEQLKVTANVDGADVYINGDKRGTTPWTGDFPVDSARRDGKTAIQVKEDGYTSDSVNVHLNPPETQRLTLRKIEKPVVVTSDVSDATVRINGKNVGTTPVTKNYWIRETLRINVSKDGNSQAYASVTAPETIKATLNETDSGGSFQTVTGIQMPTFDRRFYDNLITDLPELDIAVAQFTTTPKRVSTGDKVSFDASESYDLSGKLSNYRWDFGDGTTRSGATATHTYPSTGTYEVQLTVADSNGTDIRATKNITVTNTPPQALFTMSDTKPEVGETVTFDASQTSDPAGTVAQYSWTVDGSQVSRGQTATYTFSNPGTHTVTLEAVDAAGASDSVTEQITVLEENTPPTARMSASPMQARVNETISFDATASTDDENIKAYAWSFGDGDTAQTTSATHAYSQKGEYQVALTVRDGRGATDTVTKRITVEEANEQPDEIVSRDNDETASQANEQQDGIGSGETDETASEANRTDTQNQDKNQTGGESSENRSAIRMIVQGICTLFDLC